MYNVYVMGYNYIHQSLLLVLCRYINCIRFFFSDVTYVWLRNSADYFIHVVETMVIFTGYFHGNIYIIKYYYYYYEGTLFITDLDYTE